MRDLRVLPILLLALLVSAAATAAATRAGADAPFRFNPALDGAPVYATDAATGATWAAWALKARGEFDLAVAVREPSGVWSEPELLGRLDGLDQISPALVTDAAGNVYLAYAVRQTSQIFVAARTYGASSWSAPVAVTSPGDRGFSPTLAVLADWLVIGFRTAAGQVALRATPLVGSAVEANGMMTGKIAFQGLLPLDKPIAPNGIYDNPDGIDPSFTGGNTGSGTGSGTGGTTSSSPISAGTSSGGSTTK